ncbi:MAG: elongation factor G [Lachnospiraceae bacterium]|nr:elongation factor G [Lachnospiraceae bacterium]
MKVYTTDKIRNVVLLGHSGSGKTSMVEAIAKIAKITDKLGSVDAGNTISDFGKEEQKRKISCQTSIIPLEWDERKINIIDTPGFSDFIGEVEEAAGIADAAVIVVNGKAGIQAGTKRAWEICDKYKLPRFIHVTNMDDNNASFREVVENAIDLFGKKVAPINLPIRENEKFVGYVNVISKKAYRWEGDKAVECDVPEYNKEYLEKYHAELVESVAETSEEMMNRYFAGETFSEFEIRSALKHNVCNGSIVLVGMGSNTLMQGVYTTLDDIVKYFPSPDQKELNGINKNTNELVGLNYDFSKAKSAYVFKTMVDPYIGRYSFIKVCSGVLKTDDTLYNVSREEDFKIGKIYILSGNKAQEVFELHAGDIGALAKLSNTKTGDSLATKALPVLFTKTEISKPYTYKAYRAKEKGEIDKLAQALAKLCEEDLTLKSVNDTANHQMLLYGIGNMQLDVVASRLLNEYKVEIILEEPRVAFKETIRKTSDVEYKHKKQSGGHGQYGHVKMRFSPSNDFDNAFDFGTEVVGGAGPKNYFPAVEKGLVECCERGPLAGYPVVGVKAVLYDGSYHEVDSSEMAFKMATIGAFKDGFMKASPCLLEPIVTMRVIVDEKYTGDVIGDLTKRRGRVLGMTPNAKKKTLVEAEVPQMEIYDYITTLSSMTGGTGEFSYEFTRYEEAPKEICDKEVEKAKAMREAEKDE